MLWLSPSAERGRCIPIAFQSGRTRAVRGPERLAGRLAPSVPGWFHRGSPARVVADIRLSAGAGVRARASRAASLACAQRRQEPEGTASSKVYSRRRTGPGSAVVIAYPMSSPAPADRKGGVAGKVVSEGGG